MSENKSQRARLQSLLEESRRLVAEAEETARALDQLWAARKDARRAGRQGASSPDALLENCEVSGQDSLREPADPGAVQNEQVLVLVEGSLDDFLLLKREMVKTGSAATLRWARTGAEALSVLSILDCTSSRVCVVMDTKLPDMSGFDLLAAIKSLPQSEAVRPVVLTGDRQPSIEQRARSCGAVAFFVKPCQPGGLAEVAHALLDQLS